MVVVVMGDGGDGDGRGGLVAMGEVGGGDRSGGGGDGSGGGGDGRAGGGDG